MVVYVFRTSSLNDKHSCQLFRMVSWDKTAPTLTTPVIRANTSCAVATNFSNLAFLSSSVSVGQHEPFGSCIIPLPKLFASDNSLQFYDFLQLVVVTSLQYFESRLQLDLVGLWFLIFASYPQPFFPRYFNV